MNLFLVILATNITPLQDTLSKLGRPCFVMNGVWAVQTAMPIQSVYDAVRRAVGEGPTFIVAPSDMSWIAQRASTAKKCFD
jgi:hypothetical protein